MVCGFKARSEKAMQLLLDSLSGSLFLDPSCHVGRKPSCHRKGHNSRGPSFVTASIHCSLLSEWSFRGLQPLGHTKLFLLNAAQVADLRAK